MRVTTPEPNWDGWPWPSDWYKPIMSPGEKEQSKMLSQHLSQMLQADHEDLYDYWQHCYCANMSTVYRLFLNSKNVVFKLILKTNIYRQKVLPGPNVLLGRTEGPIIFLGSKMTKSLPYMPVCWLATWSFSRHTPFCCKVLRDTFSCHALKKYRVRFFMIKSKINSNKCKVERHGVIYRASSTSASLSSCRSSSVLETNSSTSIAVTPAH